MLVCDGVEMDRAVLVHSLQSISVFFLPLKISHFPSDVPDGVYFARSNRPGVSVVYFDEREILVHRLSGAEGMDFPNDEASMLHNVVRGSQRDGVSFE